jgi:hypothetical protein
MAMKLPSFVLHSKIKKQSNTANTLDLRENSYDPAHYDQYPWPIIYEYNSRGYRDQEWPDDLTQVIWCFGDSFTVGQGSPIDHTWCYCLQQRSQQRIINISMDGASNNWIARKIQELMAEIVPRTVVIQWSYAHRREADVDHMRKLSFLDACEKWDQFYSNIRDPSWPDASLIDFHNLPLNIQQEVRKFDLNDNNQLLAKWLNSNYITDREIDDETRRLHCEDEVDDETRRLHYDRGALIQDDINNVVNCINQVERTAAKHNTHVIHSFIPNFIDDKHWKSIEQVLPVNRYVKPFKKLDLARDSHHYGLVTATHVAEKIDQLIQEQVTP